jgi:hypothetical protein
MPDRELSKTGGDERFVRGDALLAKGGQGDRGDHKR